MKFNLEKRMLMSKHREGVRVPARLTPEIRGLGIALLCSLAIFLSSKVRVPFFPVPFTMQTFAVAIISAFAGREIALCALVVFLALWNPAPTTFGYILGFFVVPFILDKSVLNTNWFNLGCRILIAHSTILLFGAVGLSCFFGVKVAIFNGFLFFVPAEILKGLCEFLIISGRLRLPGRGQRAT